MCFIVLYIHVCMSVYKYICIVCATCFLVNLVELSHFKLVFKCCTFFLTQKFVGLIYNSSLFLCCNCHWKSVLKPFRVWGDYMKKQLFLHAGSIVGCC